MKINETYALNNEGQEKYLSDKDIAKILSVSPSCIRKQRHLRKKGEDHFFPLDSIYIGSSPRYRASDLNEWLNNL